MYVKNFFQKNIIFISVLGLIILSLALAYSVSINLKKNSSATNENNNQAVLAYTLNYTASSGGIVTGGLSQIINADGRGTAVTAVPNNNYYFTGWSDGLTVNPRTDISVVASKTITANFAYRPSPDGDGGNNNSNGVVTYSITYSAGLNGSLNGAISQTVSRGGSGTIVVATADNGYHFVSWSDGSTDNPRTDINITANKSVTATFAINMHTVIFNKNSGDTEANPTTKTANYNTTVTLPIAPTRTGHTFDSWNTQADGTGSTFTGGTVVTDDITVYAKWNAPLSAPITTPKFSPASGLIALGVTKITLTSDAGSTIYYTTDGTAPTTGSPSVPTGSKVTIDSVASPIKAMAVKAGSENSAVGSAKYKQATTEDLTSIILSDDPHNYTFAGKTYVYSYVVFPNVVTHIQITPIWKESGTITVDGKIVAAGKNSSGIILTAGQENSILITATETGKISKTYTINVLRIPALGANFQGGKLAYVNPLGVHGFIVAPSDQLFAGPWGCPDTIISGADGTALGTGRQNTIDINVGCSEADTAARIAADLNINGKGWYLPSKDELNILYLNRVAIGDFKIDHNYWSSSENATVVMGMAWEQYFGNGGQGSTDKSKLKYVRAIRDF